MEERRKKQDDAAGPFGGLAVHAVETDTLGRYDLNIIADPPYRHVEALENFDDTVHFLDAGHVEERRLAVVENRGAQKHHRAILGGLCRHHTAKPLASFDADI